MKEAYLDMIMEQIVEHYGARAVMQSFTDNTRARRWLIQTEHTFDDDEGSDENHSVERSYRVYCEVAGALRIHDLKRQRPIG